jgi:hypothetical protein
MTRGGARSRSGPPPDPNALRRSRKSDPAWTKIPASWSGEPAPEWPLVEPSTRELELWTAWWAEPVAVLWEESHALHYVAFTVRMFAEAEQPKARTEDRKSLNQMMANLYLTPDSQLRARILIVEDDGDEPLALASGRDCHGHLHQGPAEPWERLTVATSSTSRPSGSSRPGTSTTASSRTASARARRGGTTTGNSGSR